MTIREFNQKYTDAEKCIVDLRKAKEQLSEISKILKEYDGNHPKLNEVCYVHNTLNKAIDEVMEYHKVLDSISDSISFEFPTNKKR